MHKLQRIQDICCDKCWHDADKACPDFIRCLSEGPLCHKSESCSEKRKTFFSYASRHTLTRPVIFVGAGTCGLGAGAQATLNAVKQYLELNHVDAEIVEVGCIGLCVAEPMVDIWLPGKTRVSFKNIQATAVPPLLHSVLVEQKIPLEQILGQFEADDSLTPWKGVPLLSEHPFFKPQKRWVLANCGVIHPSHIEEYWATGGYRALEQVLGHHTPAEVCEEIEKSGLRGRGGGGFITGKKWKFALQTPAEQKYFICNADEGDPGAFMDRAVIEGDPHRVLEGLAIGAYAIGASIAYVYIRAEYPLAITRLKEAIAEAEKHHLLGTNILDSGFNLHIKIKMGAGAFVCGEETALIHSIEGKRGMPRPRPPFPAISGLWEKPTVINNVETLANLPLIITKGASFFNAVGTTNSKGTKVFAMSGKVCNTGLVEIPMGTSLRDIVFAIGGGIPGNKKYKAVQIGGPSGGCIPEQHLDIPIDYESLKTVGAMMGSGGMVVMDEDTCMVDVAKFFMDFIQRESCGKCISCREGTRQLFQIYERITRSHKSEKGFDALDRMQGIMAMKQLAEVIKETSLCGLGQSAPNPMLSTLRWFPEEYEAHIYDRTCPAKVCKDLLTYSIDPDHCTGCTLCSRNCPTHAIQGVAKSAHVINQNECIRCGSCDEYCRKGAVLVQ